MLLLFKITLSALVEEFNFYLGKVNQHAWPINLNVLFTSKCHCPLLFTQVIIPAQTQAVVGTCLWTPG